MQLETELTPTKTQIDRISRLEYDSGKVTVYFSTSLQIGGEELDAVFDISRPVTLDLVEIQDALDVIFAVAFNARTAQLSTPADGTIVDPPDYRGFYNELITTQIFAIARQQAGENTQANAAYTDFALALSSAVSGSVNLIALQVCLDEILTALADVLQQEDLSAMNDLIEKYRIPILIAGLVQP